MNFIAKSKRIYLRELNKNDAVHFYEINNDPEVLEYTGDEAFKTINEAKEFLESYTNQYKQFQMGRWAVCLNSTNDMIGWCGLKFHPEENVVDVGYRFYKSQWNKGFATEATLLAIEYGFNKLNLNKIVAHAHEKNVASHKVALKAGLKLTKTIIYDNKPAKFYEITKATFLNN